MTTVLMSKIMFVLYALIILGGGLMAVFSKSLVRAMVGLILTFFGVAGMYLLMAAPFMALMQLLIYVGAVVVLIFFAIMLTRASAKGEEAGSRDGGKVLLALIGCILPGVILGYVCFKWPAASIDVPNVVDIAVLGQGLLKEYVLAFEMISVVLFVAMAGAILLGFERRRGK